MLDNELMYELEDEFEGEFEGDYKDDYELEDDLYEGEYESEAFLGVIKSLARQFKPLLRRIKPIAVRAVRRAVGGGFSREGEYENEYEFEGEYEDEYEFEGEYEDEYEFEGEYEDEYEFEGEYEDDLVNILTKVASQSSSEMEAEAMVAAAAGKVLPAKSAAVRKVAPNIIRGARILTKVLRKDRDRNKTSRLVPLVVNPIVRRTGKELTKLAKQKKVTPRDAAKVMALQTKKVLSSPTTCAKAVIKSSKTKGKMTKKRMAAMR